MGTIGTYGSDSYGSSPYGGSRPAFGVQAASAINITLVRVFFNDLLDLSYAPLLSPGNYSISPTLNVTGVELDSAQSVLLVTEPQQNSTYTITVTSARSSFDFSLDPSLNQASFLGFSQVPEFFALGTAPRRVRAVFALPMTNDSNLVNPANYVLTTVDGTAVSVIGVTVEQVVHPTSVILTLGSDLGSQKFYSLFISSLVTTEQGFSLLPNTTTFQWVAPLRQFSVPLGAFSGEVQNGLYGIHGGLVFFSPALQASAANSIIQVQEVDVCTKAFDEYHFPRIPDPPVLFTNGAGVVPTPAPSTLNSNVLWAPFPRLMEARFSLTFTGASNVEPMPLALDGPCSVTLREPFDRTRVALLNDTAWHLFNNTGTSVPPTFITASNLTPIPPGAGTSIMVLNMPLGGNSALAGMAVVQRPVAAGIIGSGQLAGTLTP